ncbi:MAG TPA: rhomboid family intramembrane serine protease [Gammaproteobacteria bacterium]|nr:rhomboid family intramembrane serine protease [Gammaproteobacteria bacterium]
MFPLRDDNPNILVPYANYLIIALNVFVWVFFAGLGTEPALSTSVCRLGLIPGELLHHLPPGTRVQLGPDSVCVLTDTSSWYTIFTSMFMHGGWFHIIGNLWFLWIFGNNVEDSMGHVRFLLFYLLCGLSAAALQIASNPDSGIPMIGASGAIGGVMGAYIVLYPRVNVHMLVFLGFFVTTVAVPAYLMLGYWLLVQVISAFAATGVEMGGTAFWAHIGGFAAGAALVFLFRDRRLLEMHPYHGLGQSSSATESWRRIRR